MKYRPGALFIFFFVALLFTSCATKEINIQRENNVKLRQLVIEQNLDKAKELVAGEKYYPEDRSKLVKLMNSASLAYFLKDYNKALEFYRQALSLSDELYTTSIKAKAATLATNENLDLYYGENYERSYLRFYVALCNFHLYNHEKDSKLARQYLQNARASILDWDTFLNEIQYELAGRPSYKNDLAAKVFGAIIHQEIGTNGDLQIAKQLYKDALTVVERQYSSYPAYNANWKKYIDDYKKLPTIDASKLKSEYLAPTLQQTALQAYIERQQTSLGKKAHGQEVIFVIQQNLIASKESAKIKYPLTVSFTASMAAASGNNRALSPIQFVSKVLSVGAAAAPEIAFEYPVIPLRPNDGKMLFKLVSEQGKEVAFRPGLMAPLSEIAHQETENQKIKNMGKAGARVAGKHLASLAGLYSTYLIAARQGGIAEAVAIPAAMGSYALAAKQIAQSELADLREWTLLPSNIFVEKIEVQPGKYKFYSDNQLIKEFVVTKNEKSQLVDIFIP